tara:strand:- start:3066 stop:3602 length:537 start_codon:yes stop_codon:yes gene_type:complete
MGKSEKPKLFNKKHQKQWSETYKYKHIHTGEYCTFEAYLAEYLILRWTDEFKMEKPSYKFWTAGNKYHDMFMRNMKAARGLQKRFPEHIILEAIKSDYFKNIYHIGLKAYGPRGWKYNQVALEAIKSYNKEVKASEKIAKLAKKATKSKPIEETKEEKVRRTKSFPKQKTMFNKLRDL